MKSFVNDKPYPKPPGTEVVPSYIPFQGTVKPGIMNEHKPLVEEEVVLVGKDEPEKWEVL